MFERAYIEDVVWPGRDFAVAAPQPLIEDFAVQPARPLIEDVGVQPAGPKTGMVVDPFMPNPGDTSGMVVDPFVANPEAARRPTVFTPEVVPRNAPAALAPTDPDFTVPTADNPNFGMYGGSAGEYVAPQLQPANDKFKTPYYAAYTNDGDLAGAVMVAPGQAVRLVDAKSGEVVFEGTGPEAAQQAVGIANAVSEDRGRKAAWAIQADYGPEKGWVSQAAERYDPKRQGFFGKLADIALPILGALVAGPLGAAAGSGLSSAAQGRSFKSALVNAALSAGGAAIAPGISRAVSGALAPTVSAGAQGALQAGTQAGTQAATQAAAQGAAQGAGTLLTEVVVNGVRTLVPATVAAGLGAGVGAVGAGALTSGGGGSSTVQGNPQADTIAPNTIDEVVVTALKSGTTVQQLLDRGIPLALINSIMQANPNIAPEAGELVVEGQPTSGVDPAFAVAALPAAVAGLGVTLPSAPNNPSLVDKAVNEVKENPLDALGLALLAGAPLFGNGGGGKGGSFTVPGGPGTRESLSPVFSASLPAPTFGSRTPTAVNVDQRYAIERPEGSFFSNVPQAAGPANFAVPTPMQNRQTGIGDLNMDGVMDALDLAIFRKRFGAQGYARGGAVSGPGGGRDDMIDAKLSDGEYVIDAETVALLGDGSSAAGARKLDDLRVNVRRHRRREVVR